MRRATLPEISQMAQEYSSGSSVREIAEAHGLGHTTVYRHLVLAGVEMRSRGSWRVGWRKNPVILGRRNCGHCGRWRHLHEFPRGNRDRGVSTRCAVCCRQKQREARRDPVRGALLREYDRIWNDKRRSGPRRLPKQWDSGGYVLLPVEPLVAVLDERIGTTELDIARLARRSGVHEREIWRVRSGEIERVSLRVADSLVTALGLHLSLVYGVDDEEAVAA